MVTDRHHRIFWICFQKEQIWIQTHDWRVMSWYWNSYVEKPTYQIFSPICFLKESIHIYKITRILDMNKFPHNVHNVRRLRYSGDISQALEKLGRNFTWIGEDPTRKILSHHVEFYAMHTPSLNGRLFILRLKLNLIIYFSSHFHSLLLPSQTHPAVFFNASIRLRTGANAHNGHLVCWLIVVCGGAGSGAPWRPWDDGNCQGWRGML